MNTFKGHNVIIQVLVFTGDLNADSGLREQNECFQSVISHI